MESIFWWKKLNSNSSVVKLLSLFGFGIVINWG
jgi:hypothetical protein